MTCHLEKSREFPDARTKALIAFIPIGRGKSAIATVDPGDVALGNIYTIGEIAELYPSEYVVNFGKIPPRANLGALLTHVAKLDRP